MRLPGHGAGYTRALKGFLRPGPQPGPAAGQRSVGPRPAACCLPPEPRQPARQPGRLSGLHSSLHTTLSLQSRPPGAAPARPRLPASTIGLCAGQSYGHALVLVFTCQRAGRRTVPHSACTQAPDGGVGGAREAPHQARGGPETGLGPALSCGQQTRVVHGRGGWSVGAFRQTWGARQSCSPKELWGWRGWGGEVPVHEPSPAGRHL